MSIKKVAVQEEFSYQLPVKDKDLSSPPGTPAKGDRYIIAATGSGLWINHTGDIALCTVGGGSPSWEFVIKTEGMICWVNDENFYYKYDGSSWSIVTEENFTTVLKTKLDGIINPMLFKGSISAASDFPTLALVQSGWTYRILADVTDNDASKTNTGQSFLVDAEIAWNGTNWTDLGYGQVKSVAGKTGIVTLVKGDVGLGNVDNTSDVNKPVSTAQQTALDGKVKNDGTVNPTNLLSNGDFAYWSAGTSVAPDEWTLAGTAGSVAREATIVKLGTYSGRITAGADWYAFQSADMSSAKGINYWKGKTITCGCWCYATMASTGVFQLIDGIQTITSSFHTGNSTWQWLTATITVASNSSYVIVRLFAALAGQTAYFDGAMCVEGESAFAFSPMPINDPVPITSSGLTLKTTQYISVNIQGIIYKIAVVN